MRYCTPRGRISFEDKGAPGTQPVGLYPWYEVPGRVERDLKIVCGHWSTLGLFIGHGVHAIDTGAVWGGKLTALQLDTDEIRLVQVPGRDVPAQPPRPRPPYRGGDDRPQRPRPNPNQQGHQRRQNGRPHPNASQGPRNEAPAPKATTEQDHD